MSDKVCAFSAKRRIVCLPLLPHLHSEIHTSYGAFPTIRASRNTARAIPTQSRTHCRSADAFTCVTPGFSNAGFTRSSSMGFFVGSLVVETTPVRKDGTKEHACGILLWRIRGLQCVVRHVPGEKCARPL
jgi:hypothetical protein